MRDVAKTLLFALSLVVLLTTAHGQTPPVPNLQIYVALVDSNLDVKPVPKFLVEAESASTGQIYRGATGFDGEMNLSLPRGRYIIRSVEPARLGGKAFFWRIEIEVSGDEPSRLELSNDNAVSAKPAGTAANSEATARPVTSGTRLSLGGGFVGSVADLEFGDEIDGQGVFFAAHVMLDNGALFQFALSATEDDESSLRNDELLRAGITAGYMFRRNFTVRPFVHGGLSFVGVEEDIAGIDVIDDDSQTITLGAGLVAA